MHPYGPLAQLAEQRTFNPKVASSSLARPTTLKQQARRFSVWPFCWIYRRVPDIDSFTVANQIMLSDIIRSIPAPGVVAIAILNALP